MEVFFKKWAVVRKKSGKEFGCIIFSFIFAPLFQKEFFEKIEEQQRSVRKKSILFIDMMNLEQ